MMKLVPDTIAGRSILAMVLGLALSHLVSNLFYATDRADQLLASGGEHAVQWAATVAALTEAVPVDMRREVVEATESHGHWSTLTDEPVVHATSSSNWRSVVLLGALAEHEADMKGRDPRIAYARRGDGTPEVAYWSGYLRSLAGARMPDEMALVSQRLADGSWINVAAPLRPAPSYFSIRLGLSLTVMLLAVTLFTALVVARITAPLHALADAAEALGVDVRAPRLPESGPVEVRRTARAFNLMQDRIRGFVEDRTRMLAAIAHDLGTPITRLRLRAEFVEDPETRDKMQRDLDDMERMVRSALAFMRDDAAVEPHLRVDLGSILARICDDLTDAGGNVACDDVPRGLLVDCRPQALRRALSNLIENACKYGTSARVTVRVAESEIQIVIDDDGPGIPEPLLEEAFRPFRRLDESRNLETGGTGLGLAVARSILRAHGGDVTLQNRPGGGLRATVRLPVQRHTPSDVRGAAGSV